MLCFAWYRHKVWGKFRSKKDALSLCLEYMRIRLPKQPQVDYSRIPDAKARVRMSLPFREPCLDPSLDPRQTPIVPGVSPDVTTYNLMLHHYGLWKKVDRAEEIFLEMKTKGLRPNEDTYVALMGALTRVRLLCFFE